MSGISGMQRVEEIVKVGKPQSVMSTEKLPVSVIVAARNERICLAVSDRCAIWAESTSSIPSTTPLEIARSFGAKLVQFHYQGGWPRSASGPSKLSSRI